MDKDKLREVVRRALEDQDGIKHVETFNDDLFIEDEAGFGYVIRIGIKQYHPGLGYVDLGVIARLGDGDEDE